MVFVCSLQEQLRRLYPRIKVLSFGAKPENTLHTYLPSFLSRATPHCPDDMKKEVRRAALWLNPQWNWLGGRNRGLLFSPLSAVAQQHDGVFVRRRAEPGSVAPALHQTLGSVQVSHTAQIWSSSRTACGCALYISVSLH